jgi:NAD(P)-dependent dehydrogenase (short-subunit alcohol dehydrogenase family)
MADTRLGDTRQRSEAASGTGPARKRNQLVIGANRGIGLALVEALLRDAEVSHVIATHRPASDLGALETLSATFGEKLSLIPVEVTRQEDIDALADWLAARDGGIDRAIHVAGILHESGIEPEKSLAQCRPDQLVRLFEVNSIGPLMVARALLPAQGRKQPFVFAALSAMVGSIGDNRLGGWYGYRASKAALNQFIRTLGNECRIKHPNAVVVAIHPGTTDTDLSRPFQANVRPGKLYTPEKTAARILRVLDELDSDSSGQFFNWDGSQIPW